MVHLHTALIRRTLAHFFAGISWPLWRLRNGLTLHGGATPSSLSWGRPARATSETTNLTFQHSKLKKHARGTLSFKHNTTATLYSPLPLVVGAKVALTVLCLIAWRHSYLVRPLATSSGRSSPFTYNIAFVSEIMLRRPKTAVTRMRVEGSF